MINDKVLSGKAKATSLDPEGVLSIISCVCVLRVCGLIRLVFEEAHYLRYFIHLGEAKMYHDLKQHY